MKDPRDPIEISFSLQLLIAGVPLEESLAVAKVLYAEHAGQMRSPEEQTLIRQIWQQLQQPRRLQDDAFEGN